MLHSNSVIFDEHVSPLIVRAVESVRRPVDEERLISVYNTALTSTEDETWIESFAQEGGRFFVSADRAMLQRPTLLSIIQRTGVVGFFLHKEFGNKPRLRQLAYVSFWWDHIQSQWGQFKQGTAWIAHNDYSGKPMREVPIDKIIATKTRSAG